MKSAGMTSTDDFSVRSVLYASDGYTTHDRRFLESAASDGRTVHFVRFDGGRRVLETRSLPNGVVEVDWLGAKEPMTDGNRQNFGRAFRSVATSIRADVVHAGPVPTVGEVCATNSPVPVIVMSWASDLLIDACADGIVEAQARKALAAASHVLVDNQAIGVSAAALGADIDRLSVVPWGVDLCQFPMAPLPNTGAGPLRLVSLRSLEPVYDIATLLRAISLVNRPVEITIAGDGSMGSELRNLSEDLKLGRSITWAGRVPEPEVRNLLASHHVHVSTSRSDGSSISLLQAMATGRPSVVADIAPNREWVPPEWTFAVGDPDALAGVIDRIDVSDLAAECAASRRLAEDRANWGVNRQRILNLYDSLS